MIIKGKSCGHAGKLAKHLMRTDQNELVDILELDESHATPTIEAALLEYQTLAEHLTSAKHGLYETSLSPREDERLTPDQWEQAIDILAEELGLTGQPRIVVLHQKDGREHVHAVFQRTDTDSQKVISDSYNYPAHENAAREIEQLFNLERTVGPHSREEDEERPEKKFSREDYQKAERSGINTVEMKEQMQLLYDEAKNGQEFANALEENGYYLARGDKKNIFMVIDPQLEAHRLSSTLKGVKMAEVKAKLHPLTTANFMTVEACREDIREQEHVREEAEVLREAHAEHMERLIREQELARDRLEARQALDDQAIDASREGVEPTGIYKTIMDAFGISWFTEKVREAEDRKRNAMHEQQMQDLKREQLNERQDLQRDQKDEWFQFDQENKPETGLRSRFEVARAERRQNVFEEKMEALTEYDLGNDRWQVITEQLDRLTRQRDKVEYQANYLETLEHSVRNDFSVIFEEGEAALENYRSMAAETSIKSAAKALKTRPDQFGRLNEIELQTMQDHIESAVIDASKTHYLATRVENALQGLEVPESMISKLQKEKLEYLQSVPEEKLVLLRDLQLASTDLNHEQRKALDPEARHAISQAQTLFKDTEKRKRADELLQKQREQEDLERNRIQGLHR